MKVSYLIIIVLFFSASICNAQEKSEGNAKLLYGTWNLDSLYIGGSLNFPEPLMKKLYEQMQETKKYTTYSFEKDGKYTNTTIKDTTIGSWKISDTGDSLMLILPDKTIKNKILHINNDSLAIEPQNETKEVENSRIFLIRTQNKHIEP